MKYLIIIVCSDLLLLVLLMGITNQFKQIYGVGSYVQDVGHWLLLNLGVGFCAMVLYGLYKLGVL